MIKHRYFIVLAISLLLVSIPPYVFAETSEKKKIGDEVEVIGTILGSGQPYFSFKHCLIRIQTECLGVDLSWVDTMTADGVILEAAKKEQGECYYFIGEPGVRPCLDLEKFDNKKVKMKAKIGLCDECRRECAMCNVCCIFFLDPITIEALEEEKLQ